MMCFVQNRPAHRSRRILLTIRPKGQATASPACRSQADLAASEVAAISFLPFIPTAPATEYISPRLLPASSSTTHFRQSFSESFRGPALQGDISYPSVISRSDKSLQSESHHFRQQQDSCRHPISLTVHLSQAETMIGDQKASPYSHRATITRYKQSNTIYKLYVPTKIQCKVLCPAADSAGSHNHPVGPPFRCIRN